MFLNGLIVSGSQVMLDFATPNSYYKLQHYQKGIDTLMLAVVLGEKNSHFLTSLVGWRIRGGNQNCNSTHASFFCLEKVMGVEMGFACLTMSYPKCL